MTTKVFWSDPYLRELTAKVTSVQGACVTLDQTIFYAFSGGQESDTGMIGGHTVLKAEKTGSDILYTLCSDHTLCVADEVLVRIDWQRRYRLMRLHFAAELVLELMLRALPGLEKIGAHIGQTKARVDFARQENVSFILPEVQQTAQAIIQANQCITSAFSDEAHGQRYWQIDGFTRVPCGGTHLKRTGEIGVLMLKRANPGRGTERVEIYVTD